MARKNEEKIDLAEQYKVKITNFSYTPLIHPNGSITRMLNVQFTVADVGPFSVQVPAEPLDENMMLQLIAEKAAKIIKVMSLQL